MRPFLRACLAVCSLFSLCAGCSREEAPGPEGGRRKIVLRVGHFPNVTHAQGVVAHALSRQGHGWFEERLGPGVKIEWYVYNAGPSAMEAIFARSLDLTYVGPGPAVNAYTKSRGEEVRIISGAAQGGAALVVHSYGDIQSAADFRGKKIATPQLGNTQDVACRAWLQEQGFRVTLLGGDVKVLPTANPDQLPLFQSKSIDAVWTVEPWVSRLELAGGGRVFLEEKDALTTVLASSVAFLRDHEDLAAKFARAHAELTEWIEKHPQEAKRLLQEELRIETTRPMPAGVLERSWNRLQLTSEVDRAALKKSVDQAKQVGFLKDEVDISRLVQVSP